jgi:hypothetical protein
MKKPKTQQQDTVIIEFDGLDEYWILFPDGHIKTATRKCDAIQAAKEWLNEHVKPLNIGLGKILWK